MSFASNRLSLGLRVEVTSRAACLGVHGCLQAEWPRAIAELVAYPHIEEAAVLSTCNRMELYVVALSRNRVCVVLHAALMLSLVAGPTRVHLARQACVADIWC